jgi:hypothetical protein
MATMTACRHAGEIMGIDDAIVLRDRSPRRPDFRCLECKEPVRAHKSGGGAAAHFEHKERNAACSLSHVAR